VIRARSYLNDSVFSIVKTNSYFINEKTTLPVVSVSTDPANLWDSKIGIYVAGEHPWLNYMQDWERPANIELYETDGTQAFSIDVGIRIHGEYSRNYPQKSLSLFARKIYGSGKIKYKIFPDLSIEGFEDILLHNSGVDWNKSMLRDAITHMLVKNINIDMLYYRPAIAFLNGEYWGIHNIREKANENYIASHYNIDRDSLELVLYWGQFGIGNESRYRKLRTFIESNNLMLSENYNYHICPK
jgi:hypothetical protein